MSQNWFDDQENAILIPIFVQELCFFILEAYFQYYWDIPFLSLAPQKYHNNSSPLIQLQTHNCGEPVHLTFIEWG